jgi:hypothetical protein
MINIKSVEKEENSNTYFITYILNNQIFTYGGTPEEIVEGLIKNFKKGNKNDK